MELKFLRVPGIPRWSPRGEGSPRAQCQLQSTTKLLAQRGQLVQQFGGGVWGKGGQPLPSPQTAHLTQRILSELLAGRGPQRLFYREGLCTEYKSSSLTGLQHKLAPVTEKVIQNEGPTGPAASVQASQWETPRSPAGSPTKGGLQHPSSEVEPFHSGMLREIA